MGYLEYEGVGANLPCRTLRAKLPYASEQVALTN